MAEVTKFQIHFRKLYETRQYNAQVEVVKRTNHVIQLKISAGQKTMFLQKYLFRKNNAWKVLQANFDMHDTGNANKQMLADIIAECDKEIKAIRK